MAPRLTVVDCVEAVGTVSIIADWVTREFQISNGIQVEIPAHGSQ